VFNAIKLLLENGADINAQNTSLETPLHQACWKGNLYTVQFLIENGGDVSLLNKSLSFSLYILIFFLKEKEIAFCILQ